MNIRPLTSLVLLSMLLACARAELVPEKIPGTVPDVQAMQSPDAVHLRGWIGQRIDGNEKTRLLGIDIDHRLLDVYRNHSGGTSWDGEHVGKWLHAATLAWVNSGDAELRTKLDFVVAELLKCQQPDGYFGTYQPENYWKGWDLWSHKYNLIGLITYMRYTGNLEPMDACRKTADLLCKTYGDAPGQITIIQGPHHGLAYSSVMEPMIELYRLTGEPRYLEFCNYILRAWETERGPKIISTLLTVKQVNKVANGKAYELLSCLDSVLEVYRTTGDRQLLEACLNAWNDIEKNRLYLTGNASYRELFREVGDLPNTNNVGETCVAVTWIQFNQQLLRLTGEARFANELERVVLNQLIGSQAPDCDAWGYYVEMEGRKPYRTADKGHCCLSSGPRGLALIPTFAANTDADGVVMNLYEAGTAQLTLRDKTLVTLKTDTAYPADGRIRITVTPSAPATFAVKLRVPEWSKGAPMLVNGEPQKIVAGADGYFALRRAWESGDVVELDLTMEPRVLVGDYLNTGKAALLYGPLVLAADDALLAPEMKNDLRPLVLPSTDPKALGFTAEPAAGEFHTWSGAQVFRIQAGVLQTSGDSTKIVPREIRLVPFGEAGGFGSRYKVWLPLASASTGNLAVEAICTASTGGDDASATPAPFIGDNDISTFARSSGPDSAAHGFTATFERPVDVRRVVFIHGQSQERGAWRGWFDTSTSKPEVQVRRVADGPWIKVGELTGYPATTATDGIAFDYQPQPGILKQSTADIQRIANSRTYTLTLPKPETAIAVRVIGQPSRGTAPDTGTVDCAELQVFVREAATSSVLAQTAPTADPAATPKPKPVRSEPPLVADYTGAPFGGKAQRIPGRIELENYDEGGSNVAYYDRDPEVNKGGGYRLGEGVDLKGMILPKGRKPWYQSDQGTPTVGWMFVGEWMHYSVDVTPGTYDLSIRYGTPIEGKKVDLYLDGALLISADTPSTGEYNKWGTATLRGIKIEATGRHLLRVEAAGQDLDENDLDWIEFIPSEK